MNVLAPIRSIMSTKLITANPADRLTTVMDVFKENKIHHLPIVRHRAIVGLISRSDMDFFLRGFSRSPEDAFMDNARLRAYTAEDIMTTGLAKLGPDHRINVALEVFRENLFHAIPIVDEDEQLVGILTTFDIIRTLADEPVTSSQIIDSGRSNKD